MRDQAVQFRIVPESLATYTTGAWGAFGPMYGLPKIRSELPSTVSHNAFSGQLARWVHLLLRRRTLIPGAGERIPSILSAGPPPAIRHVPRPSGHLATFRCKSEADQGASVSRHHADAGQGGQLV